MTTITHSRYVMSAEEFEDQLTNAARAMVEHLHEEGFLSEDDYVTITSTRQVIIRKPSAWGKFWKKLFPNKKGNEEQLWIVVVPHRTNKEKECNDNSEPTNTETATARDADATITYRKTSE